MAELLPEEEAIRKISHLAVDEFNILIEAHAARNEVFDVSKALSILIGSKFRALTILLQANPKSQTTEKLKKMVDFSAIYTQRCWKELHKQLKEE